MAGLAIPIPFTGGMLLGQGFIDRLYVHMGFHPAWKYTRVVELRLDGGRLVDQCDRSAEMAELRRRIEAGEVPDPLRSRADWIQASFTLDYALSTGVD